VPPNPPFQLTPLRVDKIVAILKLGCGVIAFPIYRGGAAEWHSVGRTILESEGEYERTID
jgi:hypothetical protein